MLAGFIVELAVGLLCIAIGLVIGIGKKVSLIHDYHYRNVAEKDLPAYARLIGTGLILIGVGICATGFFNLTKSDLWWIPLLAGFAAGFPVLHRAQKKYNGSWFS